MTRADQDRTAVPLATLARRMVVIAAVLTVGLAVLLAVSLRVQATARSKVIDTLDPSSVGFEQLRSALIDQETGVRGYALGGTPDLLEPYRSGLERQGTIVAELEETLSAPGQDMLRARLDGIVEAADEWRSAVADPLLAQRDDATVAEVTEQSKPLFDEVRARLDEAEADVEAERRTAQDDLARAARTTITSVVATLLVIVAGLVVASRMLSRRVVRPVGQLNDRVRAVADGDFDVELQVDGPLELVELSRSAGRMRDRIREELRTSEDARAELHRQAEELSRSNRDLEQFAYVASHDLQEPLRKVASFCQLLEDRYADVLDDRGTTYVHFAVDGAQRMQALINDLLAFSRVGRTSDTFVAVDLDETLAAVRVELSESVRDSGATIGSGPLPTIDGDPTLLRALLSNLVSNSIKYRTEDAPEITVDAEPSGDGWRLEVRDNGIGIDAEYRDKVFVIFQRLHGRDEYEGTGIGLALCKKIVEFHGGSIRLLEPPDGRGTLVELWFPAHRERSTPSDVGSTTEPPETTRSHS